MGVQPIKVPPSLALVLNSAGDRSGVDFDYLLQTAIRESSLNPTAKAQTSSATGLFQFIESTWLEVMKDEGPRLGYQKYADAITTNADGDLVIKDKQLRQEVLALREDPQIAADLAAAFTRKNGAYLHERYGRMPSPGELYIAHFMGARGAAAFFDAGLSNPDQTAAKLFPRQARANPSIFYELGQARTVREVYRALVSRHENDNRVATGLATDASFAAQQLASGGQATPGFPVQPLAFAGPPSKWPNAQSLPSRFTTEDLSFNTLFSIQAEGASGQAIAADGSVPATPVASGVTPRNLLSPEAPAITSLFAGFGTR